MGSDWIMDPILHLVERSSGIIDPTLGSTDMSAPGYVPLALTTHIFCPLVQLRLVLRFKNDVTFSILAALVFEIIF